MVLNFVISPIHISPTTAQWNDKNQLTKIFLLDKGITVGPDIGDKTCQYKEKLPPKFL